jgi:hypothetical protein
MRHSPRSTTLALAVLTAAACGDAAAVGDVPWRTVADSSGDTIRVSIRGPMPASRVHRLVAEFTVGAVDGSEEETFGSLDDVTGTDDGGLLVWDSQAKAIRRFDADGNFLRRLGANGGGPGEHGHVNGIVRLPDGGWAVWDADGARINRHTEDGTFIGITRSPLTGWYRTDGLRADRRGLFYIEVPLVHDSITREVSLAGYLAFDTSGTVRDTLVIPMWAPEAEQLVAQTADGGSTTRWARPWGGGSEATVTPDGGLLAGFGLEYVFYILPSNGRAIRVEREHQRVAVSVTEAHERRAMITQRLRRLNPSWTWTGDPLPAVKPAYRDFRVGEDGRLWIRLSAPGEPIPDEELPPVDPANPDAVRLTTREPDLFDVYEADGTLIGRVTVPSKTRVLRARGNHLWGVRQDSLDVNYAVRFRIEPALPPQEQ